MVFTYSQDPDSAVYLFDSIEEAKEYLVGEYEFRTAQSTKQDEDAGTGFNAVMTDDHMYARIETVYDDGDEPLECVEIRVANVYLTDKQEVE